MHFVVYSIFFWETLQTALCGADLYYWFAAGFGNMEHLVTPYASPFDTPIMGSVVSLCVQFFFVYRIWVLSKKRVWWLCVIICLVSYSSNPIYYCNDLIILPVVLHCWCSSSVHRGYHCEPFPFLVTWNTTQLRQAHVSRKFSEGVTLKVLALVKS
jgi:hypothetical protein